MRNNPILLALNRELKYLLDKEFNQGVDERQEKQHVLDQIVLKAYEIGYTANSD